MAHGEDDPRPTGAVKEVFGQVPFSVSSFGQRGVPASLGDRVPLQALGQPGSLGRMLPSSGLPKWLGMSLVVSEGRCLGVQAARAFSVSEKLLEPTSLSEMSPEDCSISRLFWFWFVWFF